MEELLRQLPQKARDKHAENKRFFARLRRKPPADLDHLMQELHAAEFERTDCLQCANCCKTTGPLFTHTDVSRIAKYMNLRPGTFTERYLRMDEDNDWVLQSLPCPFLGKDNHCGIYTVRPKACREFPHTDRKKFHQITALTLKNVGICPAAHAIVERMKERIR